MKVSKSIQQLSSVFFVCCICIGIATPPKIAQQQQEGYCVSKIEQDPQILLEQSLDAKDWALSNGLVKLVNVTCPKCRKQSVPPKKNIVAQFSPFALYPSPFPRKLYQQAVDVQKAMLLLYFRASIDFEFLKEAHWEVLNSKRENYIQRLVRRLDHLMNEGVPQQVAMFCQRADYMASEDENGEYVLKQVEVNTGAVGGFATGSRYSQLHRRMVANAGIDASESVMPVDQTDLIIAETLYHTWLQFGNDEAVILFVHGSQNSHLMLESRQLVHRLEKIDTKGKKIMCRFVTITEGLIRLKTVGSNLILDDKYIVAIVFDRIGVLLTEEELALNFSFERTTAIKARPFIFSLSHTKRMQQVFTKPGMVERFFTGPGEEQMAEAIRSVQTKGWAIGADEDIAEGIRQKAIENPDGFVLKSNECGSFGEIFFKKDITKKLTEMPTEDRDYFFLMEKLRPMTTKNHFVRPNQPPTLNVDGNPELGIFGCLVGNMSTGKVSFVSRIGHMMKTKMTSVDEGGVWKGNSVYDSAYLV